MGKEKPVRILFVVNEHPNEAFGISTARETAKELQKQGFRLLVEGKDKIPKTPQGKEIVFVKIKAKETLLGRMVNGLPLRTKRQKRSEADPSWYWTMAHNYEVKAAKSKKYKPTAIYSFHCAPQGDNVYFKKGWVDFRIETYGQAPVGGRHVPTRIIEIKTIQKEIPPRPAKRIRKHAGPKGTIPLTRYLTHTTSNALNRKVGMTPEAFGKSLAKKISKEIRAIGRGRTLAPVPGRIKKVPFQEKTARKRGIKVRRTPR